MNTVSQLEPIEVDMVDTVDVLWIVAQTRSSLGPKWRTQRLMDEGNLPLSTVCMKEAQAEGGLLGLASFNLFSFNFFFTSVKKVSSLLSASNLLVLLLCFSHLTFTFVIWSWVILIIMWATHSIYVYFCDELESRHGTSSNRMWPNLGESDHIKIWNWT